ncbi:HAD-IA family hydrolase [Desulfococcaceae bacterium HSG7]|nr:HAD-IA family hydrolase [Desulfococcaceae bacterium HSG7]
MASKTAIKFKGVILYLDGVVTGTARVHGMAWESMFNDYLKMAAERDRTPFVPFDRETDYFEYVDGKSRMNGIKSFLESRGIELPFGDYEDPPNKETVCGLGNRKNKNFQKILRRQVPDIFDSTITFIKNCRKYGIKIGVASSSRNCKLILELGEIEHYFDTQVCGEVSRELNLKGKPNPDIFVVAAADSGLKPGECVVVEDSISGVQAGKNGGFGLILGIAREIDGDVLLQHGADIVVRDMAEITIAQIKEWFDSGIEADGWNLTYNTFVPQEEKLRETLTAVGNGYMGVRGHFECEKASDVHYPGTYIAGMYNKIVTTVGGKRIYNNDFVNCPNWTLIEFAISGGAFISPLQMNILSYQHNLNMKEGVMERTLVCKDGSGHITLIHTYRIVSMADAHLCAIKFEITPLNYSATIHIRTGIDSRIINDNVPRYRKFNSQHLVPISQGAIAGGVYLSAKTGKSKNKIVMAAKTFMNVGEQTLRCKKTVVEKKGQVTQLITIKAQKNTTYAMEKIVSVFTSLDKGIDNPRRQAVKALSDDSDTGIKSFDNVCTLHIRAWVRIWNKANILIDGDRFTQKVARLHTYHLMVSASCHNKTIDAGITARGLHGEACRGHVFWDEIYILPFYNYHFPQISKALLMYRYNRLDEARRYAFDNGCQGAMYPWQTADSGDEETQKVRYNLDDDTWEPDLSRRQRHVSIAIFYNVWRYFHDTDDYQFMMRYGAEMILDIARFWASVAQFDKNSGKYSIKGVMGLDEFHEKLPGSNSHGIKDNAYTNILVVWLLEKALEIFQSFSTRTRNRLIEKIGLNDNEITRWKDISRKMNVIVSDEGVISQFDGYFDLKELDWERYRKKYGDLHRIDHILKQEGDSPDEYKITKQADTLMTFYVLAPNEVARILTQLGHGVDDPIGLLKKNYQYYEQRTSHGDTLSKVVHAILSGYLKNKGSAWEWFTNAMKSDIYDTQGGTTSEGIHCGVMAGTSDVITRYFAGIDFSSKIPQIRPNLPEHWTRLAMKVCHRKIWYDLEIFHHRIKVTLSGKGRTALTLAINDKTMKIKPGQSRIMKL